MAATSEEVQAALNALLANGGQGRVAEDLRAWQTIVQPVLAAPGSDRAANMQRYYADRNRIVADAARQATGGYGSALNAARQQTESEWLRRYMAGNKPSGGGGKKGGSGGGGTDTPTTPTATTPAADPWAWVQDYIDSTNPSAPPSVKPTAPVSFSNPGGGRAAGLPKPAPRPRSYPTTQRY